MLVLSRILQSSRELFSLLEFRATFRLSFPAGVNLRCTRLRVPMNVSVPDVLKTIIIADVFWYRHFEDWTQKNMQSSRKHSRQ